MARIHPTAIIGPDVQLAESAEIGAYAVLKGHVKIGEGTVVHESTHIEGDTVIGRKCRLGPAAYIGLPPQHLKYNGERTRLVMGDEVVIRETAVVHRGFKTGPDDATVLGDRCYLMHQSHIGHDSVIANDVILAAGAMLAGHCQIGERVFIGGGTKLHQFCRVGRLAIIAGNEGISRDIPPFSAARYGGLKAYNAIGCRRAGLSQSAIHSLRAAFYCLHHHRHRMNAVAAIHADVQQTPEVKELLEFIMSTKRGIHPSVHFRRPFQDED